MISIDINSTRASGLGQRFTRPDWMCAVRLSSSSSFGENYKKTNENRHFFGSCHQFQSSPPLRFHESVDKKKISSFFLGFACSGLRIATPPTPSSLIQLEATERKRARPEEEDCLRRNGPRLDPRRIAFRRVRRIGKR